MAFSPRQVRPFRRVVVVYSIFGRLRFPSLSHFDPEPAKNQSLGGRGEREREKHSHLDHFADSVRDEKKKNIYGGNVKKKEAIKSQRQISRAKMFAEKEKGTQEISTQEMRNLFSPLVILRGPPGGRIKRLTGILSAIKSI